MDQGESQHTAAKSEPVEREFKRFALESEACAILTSRDNYRRTPTAVKSAPNTNWRRNIQIKRNTVRRPDATEGRRTRAMDRRSRVLPPCPTAQPNVPAAGLFCSQTWFDCKRLRANVNVLCAIFDGEQKRKVWDGKGFKWDTKLTLTCADPGRIPSTPVCDRTFSASPRSLS